MVVCRGITGCMGFGFYRAPGFLGFLGVGA